MEQIDLYKKFGIETPHAFDNSLDVLIAESHNELRLILSHHLNKLGFKNVRTAREGLFALKELKTKSAEVLIVTDDLPEVSGLDLLRELKENHTYHRGAFLYLSKAMNKNEFMLAIETGIDDVMVKPIVPADVLPKMKAAYTAFINPKNPERLYEHAKVLIRDKKWDEAQAVYDALTQSAEHAARPFVGLARVALGRGKAEEALKQANLGLARNQSFVHAYALRAEIQLVLGNLEAATDDLKKAVDLSPLNIARYESCCEVLLKQDLLEPCIAILEKGVTAGLQHPFVIERLGFCYFRKKDYPSALRYLKEAVKLEPSNVSFMNSLAICYRDAKDFEKSIQTYNMILKKEPDNYLVLFNKALVCLSANNQEEAIKLLRRVVKIDPTYAKAKDKLTELGAKPE